MQPDEKLSHCIGDIYDAALEEHLWPDVLGKIADFVGGRTAGLLSKDVTSRHGDVQYHFGCNPYYLQLHRQTYWKFDPLSPLPYFAVGEVTSARDYMPDDEFREGRFFREWLQPQGLLDLASVVLERSLTSSAILTVIRSEASGPVDDEMRHRMRLIAPHVRRAVLVGRVIDLKQTEAATFADTLDGLSAGIFLADAGGRIVHANCAGHALLSSGDCLSAIGGRLKARDVEADQALRAVFTAAANENATALVGGISIPLTARNGERNIAHILPLTSGARRRAGTAYDAVVAIFVQKASSEGPSHSAVMARHFKLTPTELRVMLAIVEIGGAPGVAEALGIAHSTVKTHLGRLYEKTGAARHSDLVKLVAEFSSPLLG